MSLLNAYDVDWQKDGDRAVCKMTGRIELDAETREAIESMRAEGKMVNFSHLSLSPDGNFVKEMRFVPVPK